MKTQRALLLLALAAVVTISMADASLCRQWSSCNSCLNDPSCGWCATTGTCAPGTSSGPSEGNCTRWDFNQCGSGAPSTVVPSTTTPAPSPTFTPAPSGGSWIGQGGDSQRTRRSRDTLGDIHPVKKWTFATGPGVVSAPVAYKGQVLFTVYQPQQMGPNATLFSLNQLDGSLAGTYNAGEVDFVGPPTVEPHQDLVFIQLINWNQANDVVALKLKRDTRTGNVSFQYQWTGTQAAQWPKYDQGVVSDGKLVYVPGGEYNGVLSAFSIAEQGLQVWSQQLYSTEFGCDSWGPTLDHSGAQVLWSSEAGEDSDCAGGGVLATTGASTWTSSFNCSWDGYSTNWSPVVAPSGLILLSPWGITSNSVTPTAVSRNANGSSTQPVWTSATCGWTSGHTLSPAVDDEYAFWVCSDGVHKVALSNGASTTIFTSSELCGSPIVTADYIFVMTPAGVAIVSKDGSFSTSVATSGGPYDMAYSNGWIFVATATQTVDGIQLHHGTPPS